MDPCRLVTGAAPSDVDRARNELPSLGVSESSEGDRGNLPSRLSSSSGVGRDGIVAHDSSTVFTSVAMPEAKT